MRIYPIDSILPQLRQNVLANSSVVLRAPPGAGKTTRAPIALLDLIPPGSGRIVMLEPRRIAAVSAARWMAHVLGEDVGETVGYTIRFDRRVSKSTRIEVVTEGVLTRRIQTDPGLDGVAMVIFDEFHERSLHSDLALSLCIDIRKGLREDLKILVMSATLDCGPIAALLDNAPVITSEGRAFHVEERYLADRQSRHLSGKVSEAVTIALKETSGDILVFLPGAGEIRACSETLQTFLKGRDGEIAIHPLYGNLTFEEQETAILPSEIRKIVLATNIAETSLTIEGVNVVIDSGLTRRLQYDPSSGMNRLITIPVSRASAEQRTGRAGRLGPGVCYRLYSRHAFKSLVPFAPPEITVSDLSSLVLELAAWGVKDPSLLSWLDQPPVYACESARRLLTDLGAIDNAGSVTLAGRGMATLPLHPRLGRLLLRAGELGCLSLGADLASLLSERDILRQSAAIPADPDISGRIDILHMWRLKKESPDFADKLALRAVDRTAKQLMRLMHETGRTKNDEIYDTTMVSRLLLCAFPDRVAKRREEGDGRFVLSQGRGVRLSATSSMAKSTFIIAAHLDAGEKTEGMVHLSAELSEDLIRQELSGSIRTVRKVEWDRREERIIAAIEERLGSILLSVKAIRPSDEEVAPIICDIIKVVPDLLSFSKDARQFQTRVSLISRVFPEEYWPDLSPEFLFSHPEEWLLPWVGGTRTAKQLGDLDILQVMRARLGWNQQKMLDERAPTSVVVPSGSRVALDYTAGDIPVLAVKLQEMFGLADTPVIADGRVKVLLHLLSPARRPVQITQDLKGFWDSGYQQIKKELRGRYPKHPWPDDPWNAIPTRRTRPRLLK